MADHYGRGLAPRETAEDASVHSWIVQLGSANWATRRDARLSLVKCGVRAVDALIKALSDPDAHVRWEAAKALVEIADPASAPALVRTLADRNYGVRWLAAEGLTALGCYSLKPLLLELLQHSDRVWLREGAHHVFRMLLDQEDCSEIAPMLPALEQVGPELTVPVAARAALEALYGPGSVAELG